MALGWGYVGHGLAWCGAWASRILEMVESAKYVFDSGVQRDSFRCSFGISQASLSEMKVWMGIRFSFHHPGSLAGWLISHFNSSSRAYMCEHRARFHLSGLCRFFSSPLQTYTVHTIATSIHLARDVHPTRSSVRQNMPPFPCSIALHCIGILPTSLPFLPSFLFLQPLPRVDRMDSVGIEVWRAGEGDC